MKPEEILEGLNAEQRAVVQHAEGPLLVGAVAGAGKTTALVKRIAYLITTGKAEPGEILAVTFSKRAAQEMNERLRALGVTQCRVGTWHSLAFQICREEGLVHGFDIDTSSRYRTILKTVTGHKGMKWAASDITVLTQYVTRCKAVAALPDSDRARKIAEGFYQAYRKPSHEPSQLLEAYQRAELERRERLLLTFDDMLVEAFYALKEGAKEEWAGRWNYVLQDECQDENEVQQGIGEMLAETHRNYMVVGDPAQAIYGFRGSSPKGLLTFEERWGAKRIAMHRNYRSAPEIIEAANATLAAMSPGSHLGMEMTACRSGIDETVHPVMSELFDDAEAEASAIAETILTENQDGRSWGDHAVLYRVNALSRSIEEALLSERIPYVVVGGTSFYERREVRSLLSYLRIADGRGTERDVKNAINAPFRFLGAGFVEKVQDQMRAGNELLDATRIATQSRGIWAKQRAAALEWASLIDGIGHTIQSRPEDPATEVERQAQVESRPAVLIRRIVADTGYIAWLRRDEGTESAENDRASNVKELIRSAERFPTVGELLDYVDDQIERRRRALREGVKGDQVTLMSIHRSKGLEWPIVHLAGCIDGVMPHAKAGDMDEERRLFYVAVTRARDSFRVSAPMKAAFSGKIQSASPSPFIDEMGA